MTATGINEQGNSGIFFGNVNQAALLFMRVSERDNPSEVVKADILVHQMLFVITDQCKMKYLPHCQIVYFLQDIINKKSNYGQNYRYRYKTS